MTFAVTVNLREKTDGAFQPTHFVEQVKRMHHKRNKGFEEEFQVTEAQHECVYSFMYSYLLYKSMLKHV